MRTEYYTFTVKNGVIVKAREAYWVDGKKAIEREIVDRELLKNTLIALQNKAFGVKG